MLINVERWALISRLLAKLDSCTICQDQLICRIGGRIAPRMRKTAVEQGRSKVHGAKYHERHVCRLWRDNEPAVTISFPVAVR